MASRKDKKPVNDNKPDLKRDDLKTASAKPSDAKMGATGDYTALIDTYREWMVDLDSVDEWRERLRPFVIVWCLWNRSNFRKRLRDKIAHSH